MMIKKQEQHLSFIEIKKYIKNELTEDEELEIDEHIAECDKCLKKFVATERLIETWDNLNHESLKEIAKSKETNEEEIANLFMEKILMETISDPAAYPKKVVDKLKKIYNNLKEKAWIKLRLYVEDLNTNFVKSSIKIFNKENIDFQFHPIPVLNSTRGNSMSKTDILSQVNLSKKEQKNFARLFIKENQSIEIISDNISNGNLVILLPIINKNPSGKPLFTEFKYQQGRSIARFENISKGEYIVSFWI